MSLRSSKCWMGLGWAWPAVEPPAVWCMPDQSPLMSGSQFTTQLFDPVETRHFGAEGCHAKQDHTVVTFVHWKVRTEIRSPYRDGVQACYLAHLTRILPCMTYPFVWSTIFVYIWRVLEGWGSAGGSWIIVSLQSCQSRLLESCKGTDSGWYTLRDIQYDRLEQVSERARTDLREWGSGTVRDTVLMVWVILPLFWDTDDHFGIGCGDLTLSFKLGGPSTSQAHIRHKVLWKLEGFDSLSVVSIPKSRCLHFSITTSEAGPQKSFPAGL